jgi:hypothetical protein
MNMKTNTMTGQMIGDRKVRISVTVTVTSGSVKLSCVVLTVDGRMPQ